MCHLRSYLEQHRPKPEELAEWSNTGEDHLFLSEIRQSLTINGVEQVCVRLRQRAGLKSTPVSPQVFRHTFALRYLQAGGNLHELQALLGYGEQTTIKHYLRLHEQLLQEQNQKESSGDDLSPDSIILCLFMLWKGPDSILFQPVYFLAIIIQHLA